METEKSKEYYIIHPSIRDSSYGHDGVIAFLEYDDSDWSLFFVEKYINTSEKKIESAKDVMMVRVLYNKNTLKACPVVGVDKFDTNSFNELYNKNVGLFEKIDITPMSEHAFDILGKEKKND